MSIHSAAMLVFILLICSTAVVSAAQADAVPTVTATEQPLPLRRDKEVLAPQLLVRVGAVLILGVALAVATVFVLRRTLYRSTIGNNRRIQIIEARRATPQLTIVLVRFDDRELLVAQAGNSVELICDVAAIDQETHNAPTT